MDGEQAKDVCQVASLAEFAGLRRQAALDYLGARRRIAADEIDAIDRRIAALRGDAPPAPLASGNGHEPDDAARAEITERRLGLGKEPVAEAAPEPAPKASLKRRVPRKRRVRSGSTLSPEDVLDVLKSADGPMAPAEIVKALNDRGAVPAGVSLAHLQQRVHNCLSNSKGRLWRNLGRGVGWEALEDA